MSADPIRIIRIIARLNVGGPAKHVAWLTAALQPPEFRTLLVTGTVPSGEEDMSYFAEELGVVPYVIPEISREISPKDLVAIWKLYRLFLRERPQIVHTHTAKAGTVGRIAGFFYRWLTFQSLIGRPRNCKFVHTYHGHIFHGYYGPLKTRMFITVERLLTRFATDRVVVISENQLREIAHEFRVGNVSQFAMVPLGLDLNSFANRQERRGRFRDELGIEGDTFLVGIVGRLTAIKNHQMFLRAIARFKQMWQGFAETRMVKFVIIGDGSLRQSLELLSSSLGLEKDVIFAGWRRDPENFYAALDAVALTSLNEGTPLTLIEAMSNECPVIATNVGGVTDLLGDPVTASRTYQLCPRGLSTATGDEESFAAALVRLAQDGELRNQLSLNGRQFVEKHYSVGRLLTDIKDLYGELIEAEMSARESSATAERLQSRV